MANYCVAALKYKTSFFKMGKTIKKKAIQASYKLFVVTKKTVPSSIKELAEFSDIQKQDIKKHYPSPRSIEAAIFKKYFKTTLAGLKEDERFDQFSLHEKHLSFLFTLVEVAGADKKFIKRLVKIKKRPDFIGAIKLWTNFAQDKTAWLGTELKFLKKMEKPVSLVHKKILWQHAWSVLIFWAKDKSENQSETDAFIEKSTGTFYQVLNISALDSVVDFGKFMSKHMGLKSIFEKLNVQAK